MATHDHIIIDDDYITCRRSSTGEERQKSCPGSVRVRVPPAATPIFSDSI